MHASSITAAALVLALGAGVQPRTPAQTTTKHLTLATSVSPDAAAPGGRASLVVEVTPKPAMHVYAPGQKNYIPISLALEANDAVKPLSVQFPTPEKLFVKALDETQLIYTKPFRIVQEVAVAGNRTPLTVKGAVKYQACDDSICYPPVTVPVTWTLHVKRPAR